MPSPIEQCLQGWHQVLEQRQPAPLESLLADDAVFISPILHRPQTGKVLTLAYLTAAAEVIGNDSFRYLDELRAERRAVLEFATELDGLTVNGVDLIRCDEAGRITEFKVMLRPLKAINAVQQAMARVLMRNASNMQTQG